MTKETFNVEKQNDTTYALYGLVDERADLEFFANLKGDVAISLRGIKRINSFGVRGWIEAINRIPAGAQVSLVECPPPIIDQVNMFAGFVGKARIHSFYVPMTCECGHEEERLFTVVECQKNGNRVPTSSCPKCKERELEADIFEQQYLTFLQDA